MANHPNLPKPNPDANVSTAADFDALAPTVDEIVVDQGCLNNDAFTTIDLSRFTTLKRLAFGNHCCSYVEALELTGLDALESLTIGNNCFMSVETLSIDLGALRRIVIGEGCFESVDALRLVGMNALESVEIGGSCFSKGDGALCVKDCPSLREFKTGAYSFYEYVVCEIENVEALEAIEIGPYGFAGASLELKGFLVHKE